jgi:hypothetical protein
LLLPPSEGPAPAIYKQKLELLANDVSHQILVLVKLDPSLIKLRGMTPTGQALYTIEYDGTTLNQEMLTNIELPSEEIMTMLQFALWPSDVLQKYYRAELGWEVDIQQKFRQLSLNGQTKLRVSYQGESKLVLTNYVNLYEVKIETLEYISL